MHWVRLEKYEFSRNGKWKLGWLSSMKNASQKRKVSSQLVEFKWSWKPCINGDLSLFMKGMCYVGVRLIILQICFFFHEFLHLHMTSIMDPMISHVFQAHLWNFCVPSSFDVEWPFCSPIHCSFFLPFAGSFSFVWAWSHNEEEFYLIFCLFLDWGPLLG